jgi:hypothetical protein
MISDVFWNLKVKFPKYCRGEVTDWSEAAGLIRA